MTLLLASDPSCKTHFPHNSPHRIIRTSYGRQTHACAVLPLPPPLPRAMTTTAMLKSSRRPLLIYYHDSLAEAADQIRSGLKLPSGAVAALPRYRLPACPLLTIPVPMYLASTAIAITGILSPLPSPPRCGAYSISGLCRCFFPPNKD